jgi:hypothetical protein
MNPLSLYQRGLTQRALLAAVIIVAIWIATWMVVA